MTIDTRDPRRNSVSVAVETKLVDTLFEQPGSLLVGLLSTVALTILAYAHSGRSWMLFWSAATIVLFVGRMNLLRMYSRRPAADTPLRWIRKFAIFAALNSLAFGTASAIAVLQGDAFTQMIIVTAQLAYISSAAVRNNAVAKVAKLQVSVAHGMLAAACVATRNPFYIGYGLLASGHLLGVIKAIDFLSGKTRALLVAQERAEEVNGVLEGLATTDALTGAVNRRGFDAVFTAELALAARTRRPLSLLMLDIDHFKALNDAEGHQRGDECLRLVSACMRETVCRPEDVVSRYGGEEFAILLPGTDADGARSAAERVRQAVENAAIGHPTGPGGRVTISIGYASVDHDDRDDPAAIIKRADDALYMAKSKGRNRVVGWENPPCPMSIPLLEISAA